MYVTMVLSACSTCRSVLSHTVAMLFQVFGAQRIGDPATYVVKLVTVAECDLQGQRHEVTNQVTTH